MSTKKCVVLFSGRGTNLKNLLHHQSELSGKMKYVAAFTNNPNAYGINICNDYNLKVVISNKDNLESNLTEFLLEFRPDIIILAGYMKIVPDKIVSEYASKIINLHPSLLPKYPGLNTYEKVLKNKDRYHGATVHFVTKSLDDGPIILQGKFQVNKNMNLSDLERLTHKVEYKIFPIVVKWIAEDIISIDDKNLKIKDKIIKSPITYIMKNEDL